MVSQPVVQAAGACAGGFWTISFNTPVIKVKGRAYALVSSIIQGNEDNLSGLMSIMRGR